MAAPKPASEVPGPRLPRALQSWLGVVRPVEARLAMRKRYGKLFRTSDVFAGRLFHIADRTLIEQVFKWKPAQYNVGEPREIMEPVTGPSSILLLDGDRHMRMRKLMLPPFHGEAIAHYAELVEQITNREIDGWRTGEVIRTRTVAQVITMEVIIRAVFGITDPARVAELKRLLPRLSSINPVLGIEAMRRDFGPRSPWGRFIRVRDRVDEIVYEEIARRRGDPDPDAHDDILALLLSARDDEGEPLTDRELRDELITILLAGHETTATSIGWAFERLLRTPRVLDRLIDELREGDGEEYVDAEKQKIAFNGNVQDYCWCYSYFITNAEAAWDFHVYPNNNWMATWSYPATKQAAVPGRRVAAAGSSVQRRAAGEPATRFRCSIRRPVSAYGSRFVIDDRRRRYRVGRHGQSVRVPDARFAVVRHRIARLQGRHADDDGQSEIRNVSPLYDVQYITAQRAFPPLSSRARIPSQPAQALKLMLGLYAQDQWTLGETDAQSRRPLRRLECLQPGRRRGRAARRSSAELPRRVRRAELEGHQPSARRRVRRVRQRQDGHQGSFGRYVNYETTGLTQADQSGQRARRRDDPKLDRLERGLQTRLRPEAPGPERRVRPDGEPAVRHDGHQHSVRRGRDEGMAGTPYNKQMSAVVQHELRPGFGVTIGYFRTEARVRMVSVAHQVSTGSWAASRRRISSCSSEASAASRA